MEREEVGSLRQAMDDMIIEDPQSDRPEDQEERRLYNAALDEASELVWQHRNGNRRTPDPHAPYRYKPHMRKNSYQLARAASLEKGTGGPPLVGEDGPSSDATIADNPAHTDSDCDRRDSLSQRGYAAVSNAQRPPLAVGARRSSMKRNISGEIERPFSGDQIWEEPSKHTDGSPAVTTGTTGNDATLVAKLHNTQSRTKSVFEKPRGHVNPFKTRSTVEIHRNPPSQSHNPLYTVNVPTISVKSDDQTPRKHGLEIRGDDIRDATSMKLKDRSAKLPTPSAVSNRPGRPIVSFDVDWKAPEETTDPKSGPAYGGPSAEDCGQTAASMVIPSIVVAEETPQNDHKPPGPAIPSIIVQDAHEPTSARPEIPIIVTPDDDDSDKPEATPTGTTTSTETQTQPSVRPLPSPGAASSRRSMAAGRGRTHWSPSPCHGPRTGTECHECGLVIEGRFVALAGISHRFHPKCFSCYACGTSLEALEISPEPDAARQERLGRIQRRACGEILEEIPGKTAVEDGDERLRFFCHLDWHELFAPKCKHCKTPILGEHIVALGQHWHYGHFFCAECGDPFEQGMTHIEKDGYAWCINCQTKRTERRAPKCKMCGVAVIGQYLRALGGEWHDECFRCAHCRGGFEDGQIFPKEENGRMVVLCTGCRMVELKA